MLSRLSKTTTRLVNRGAFCFSVAGGKLLVHTAVCDVCGVVFLYSGRGGGRLQNNPEMLLYVEESLFCCCRVGSGGRDAVPHGK